MADRAERRTLAIAGTFALVLSAIALLLLTITPGAIHAQRDLAGVRRRRAERDGAQLHAAGGVRALRGGRAARALSERGRVAHVDRGISRRSPVRRAGGLLYGFAGPALAYGGGRSR